jgi:hypothetical protein
MNRYFVSLVAASIVTITQLSAQATVPAAQETTEYARFSQKYESMFGQKPDEAIWNSRKAKCSKCCGNTCNGGTCHSRKSGKKSELA